MKGREIILAGGSGGLGRAAAELLAAEGARLVVSYRENRERALQLSSVAEIVQADLSSAADRARLLDAAPEFYGLVVFSGTAARVPDPEQAMRVSSESNYIGPALLAREAAARMKQRSMPGAIVLVASMQGTALFAGSTAYAAAKAALIHAGRVLAKEMRGKANIRVNVVCPGVNDAGMAQASIASGKYDGYLQQDVIHRFGKAADQARAVRFFLEPDNYITGQVLTVDGGLTL